MPEPEHAVLAPFTWLKAPELPLSGQDWRITILGPEDESATYHVHLNVIAPHSQYFSKYALDDEEKYRETANREVVFNWSEMQGPSFYVANATFCAWLDLVYNLVGCHVASKDSSLPTHLQDHAFFTKEPFVAACILDYVDTPKTHECLFKQAKLQVLMLPVSYLVTVIQGFAAIRGEDWHTQWIIECLMKSEKYDIENMSLACADQELIIAIMNHLSQTEQLKQHQRESFFIALGYYIDEYKDSVTMQLFGQFTNLIFLKIIAPVSPKDVPDKLPVTISHKLVVLLASLRASVAALEIEKRLRLANKSKQFEYHNEIFHLTTLQDILTTKMAKVVTPQFHYDLSTAHAQETYFKQWSDLIKRLSHLPTVSHAFQLKQTLVCSGQPIVVPKQSRSVCRFLCGEGIP